ncbi:MAG: phage terminase large subunit [Oscillospiraceae bacterium]|nr:phage terminase large subunit [Oscillospiraceae bacterium]
MTTWEVKNGVKEIILTGTPQKAQIPFFKSRNRHTCYGGARGGGKSWAMRRKLVMLACRYAGLKILLLRRTYPEIATNHINQLMNELIPCGIAKYNDSKKTFTFANGSTIKLGYCASYKDSLQYQGQEYDVQGFEEATGFEEEWVNFIQTALRTTRKDFTPRAYYTCNPGGVGHSWVKRLFIDRNFNKNENPDDYVFYPAKVDDNEFLRDTEYKQMLMKLPEDLRRAHLDGDWDVYAGQYFKEFKRDLHTCPPFEIPNNWTKFRALDYGQDMTACLWFAVSTENRVYIYRELYEPNLILSQAALRIKELTPKEEKIAYTTASPDLWNSRQETGTSGVEIMRKSGLSGIIKANNSRVSGWRVIKEYLHFDKDKDGGEPKMQIFENCKNLIRTLPQLQYDQRRIEDVAREPHELSHAPEALRYGLMSRPRAAILPNKKKEIWDFEKQTYTNDGLFGFGGAGI